MPKKGAPQSGTEEEPIVTLRPLFGRQPTQYLPWLLSGILVILLFLILFLPGILRPGSEVTFTSRPAGAAVYMDGTRIGATPVTTFVEAGSHEIRVSKPFHASQLDRIEVEGRLFGSLIVARKERIHTALVLEDAQGLVEDAGRRFSAWALAGDQHGQYQYPPVLSNAVISAYAAESPRAGTPPAEDSQETAAAEADRLSARELVDPLLESALGDLHTTAALKDYLRAALIDAAGGSNLSPFAMARFLQQVAEELDARPGLPFAVATALPDSAAQAFEGSPWYEEFTGRYVTSYIASTSESAGANGFATERIAGYRFVRIPGGRFVQGLAQFDSPLIDPPDAQPPIIRRVEPFLMLDREVTRELYARFIAERPMWDRSNISQLQEAGLVDDRYLAWRRSEGSNPGDSPAAEPATEAAPMLPASHVSYHAAVAFAAWFQEQLPPEWSNWTVRLPSEAEWEWAARAVSTTMDEAVFRTGERAGPSPLSTARAPAAPVADLLGNLWEWTGSWYHPTAYAAARQLRADGSVVSTELFDQTPGAQRVVRGGSWANPPRSIGVVSRGAQPPEASTPFLGFRIVIVETADG